MEHQKGQPGPPSRQKTGKARLLPDLADPEEQAVRNMPTRKPALPKLPKSTPRQIRTLGLGFMVGVLTGIAFCAFRP